MLGVLLNLLLGLSRVALAMARRNDLPRQLAVVSAMAMVRPIELLFLLVLSSLV